MTSAVDRQPLWPQTNQLGQFDNNDQADALGSTHANYGVQIPPVPLIMSHYGCSGVQRADAALSQADDR